MLELTARVVVSRSDQMRGIIRDRGSEFRVYYMKEMARQLAQALMETPGAVEISEYMNPQTGDLELRARCVVATNGERGSQRMTVTEVRMRQEQATMDAMRSANPLRQVFFNASSGQLESKTLDAIEKAIGSSKAKVRADNEIRKSTRTPGEALPVVEVRVRKIQMPEEAKG
jgi:hypothetical protein